MSESLQGNIGLENVDPNFLHTNSFSGFLAPSVSETEEGPTVSAGESFDMTSSLDQGVTTENLIFPDGFPLEEYIAAREKFFKDGEPANSENLSVQPNLAESIPGSLALTESIAPESAITQLNVENPITVVENGIVKIENLAHTVPTTEFMGNERYIVEGNPLHKIEFSSNPETDLLSVQFEIPRDTQRSILESLQKDNNNQNTNITITDIATHLEIPLRIDSTNSYYATVVANVLCNSELDLFPRIINNKTAGMILVFDQKKLKDTFIEKIKTTHLDFSDDQLDVVFAETFTLNKEGKVVVKNSYLVKGSTVKPDDTIPGQVFAHKKRKESTAV